MPGKASSQWDFGELFGPQQTREVWTVSELTARVRARLEPHFYSIWVKGEVSNLHLHNSGHIYFTLKDACSQLSCALFRNQAGVQRNLLANGQMVLAGGDLGVYEARGQYQLVVRELEPLGRGALQAAFERLKQKLQAEGLFETARKRKLPRWVYRVGVVTSPSGAAFQDLLSVWRRRFAGMEIILAPCRVQGEGAAAEIAAAIAKLNQWHAAQPAGSGLHALLVTRGGGSLEDLWAFNEEVVARAIFHSTVPVVSAVGHEIDLTISDFVADVRAPTPSAAAELLSEGMLQAGPLLSRYRQDLRQNVAQRLARLEELLHLREARLARCHPRRRLQHQSQRLDELMERLQRQPRRQWQNQLWHYTRLLQQVLRLRPGRWLARRTEQLAAVQQRLHQGARQQLQERQRKLQQLLQHLRLLSPQHTLERGYSITQDPATGRILRRAGETGPGRVVVTRLAQGQVVSRVENTQKEAPEDPLVEGPSQGDSC